MKKKSNIDQINPVDKNKGGYPTGSGIITGQGTILAAGLGTRMEPLTRNLLPKPMFPLAGKTPISELWVHKLVAAGIRNISMNLCVLGETLENYFQNGRDWNARISFLNEEKPTGTLGGIAGQVFERAVGDSSPESTIIAPSGDIVTGFDHEDLLELYDIHKKKGAAVTIVLVPVPWNRRKDFGTALIDNPEIRSGKLSRSGQITEFFEKNPNSPSNLNNASIYIIEKEFLNYINRFRTEADLSVNEPFYDFGKHVFPAMLGKLSYRSLPKDFSLWGVQYDGIWFDVGQKRDYLRVNECVLDEKIDVPIPFEKTDWGYIGDQVAMDSEKVRIVPPVVIGNGCEIGPGSVIGPYAVIGDNWKVGKNVRILNSVLWETYPFIRDNGTIIPETDRKKVDEHRIMDNTLISESIVTGGKMDFDIVEKTVIVEENGDLSIMSINFVPDGDRP